MEPTIRQFSPHEKVTIDNQDGHCNSDIELGHEAPRNIEIVPTYLQPPISLRERLHHFTFAWYTLTMSTGGIGLCLGTTPHRFRGLDTIGLVIFLFDVVCFIAITTCLLLRFTFYKGTFTKIITRTKEAIFIPTCFLSIAAMLSNTELYGTKFLTGKPLEYLIVFMRVMFWIYTSATFLMSILSYQLLFTVQDQRRLTVNSMTPGWILPIFPIMLAGTVAAFDAADQPPDQAMAMIAVGIAAQGLGFFVATFLYATYISRLIVYGLPSHRQVMFIAVGPPSFTCAAIIGMSNDIPRVFAAGISLTADMGNTAILADAIRLAALYCSLFLWGLSFWFFASAVSATVTNMGGPDREFHLSWWSFVFPNVGFCVSTVKVGTAFGSEGLLWFATALCIALVITWLYVGFKSATAVVRREIMWPGHDEDSD